MNSSQSQNPAPLKKKLTAPGFTQKKRAGEKITMLTAYDYSMAVLLEQASVDSILVGDSLGMVVQGHETTIPVTLEQIIYHTELVTRGATHTMVIADLPFPINHMDVGQTILDAAEVLKQAGCSAVKLEGGREQAELIEGLVTAGIPVMAHTGLRPQSFNTMGGYKVQRDRAQLLSDARAAEDAGAFGIVLECVPTDIAGEITDTLTIPTIGIGAGPQCDGQVLVTHDLIGLTTGYVPRFVKPFANVGETIQDAVVQWTKEIESGNFPDSKHSFS